MLLAENFNYLKLDHRYNMKNLCVISIMQFDIKYWLETWDEVVKFPSNDNGNVENYDTYPTCSSLFMQGISNNRDYLSSTRLNKEVPQL